MKRFMIATLFLGLLASCSEIVIVEPGYDYRDDVVGYYDIEEYSDTYHDYVYYTLHIYKSASRNRVWLDNFYGADISVDARIDRNIIIIPHQIVADYEIEGTGTIHGNSIRMNYSVRDLYNGTRTDYCDAFGEGY